MRRAKGIFGGYKWDVFVIVATVALLVLGVTGVPSMGQQKGQKTFSSPEEASKALFAAVSSNDEQALLEIFGPKGKEVISSGDAAEDAESRSIFSEHYKEMNRLVKEPDGSVTLYIGAHNWPTPIPIVNKGNLWYFDTEAGAKEIVFRRVGRNEMSAIRLCQELVEAQKEYYSQYNEYAQKISSDEGKHDGLYWKAAENGPQSPIGPLVAQAVADKFAVERQGSAVPYRGYFFHVLTGQGKGAPGGAKSYLVGGKMTGGFAFVAYPAEYRSSGVMTFVVGADGVVYEKDLGTKTESIVNSMKNFNPDSTWNKVEMEEQRLTPDLPILKSKFASVSDADA